MDNLDQSYSKGRTYHAEIVGQDEATMSLQTCMRESMSYRDVELLINFLNAIKDKMKELRS